MPHLNPDWFYVSDTGLPKLSWKIVVVVVVELLRYSDTTNLLDKVFFTTESRCTAVCLAKQ